MYILQLNLFERITPKEPMKSLLFQPVRPLPILIALVAVLASLNIYQFLARSDGSKLAGPEPVGVEAAKPEKKEMPKSEKQEIVDRFHKVSYDDQQTWLHNRWLGIPAQQNPNDVWIHQEIIFETTPDYIVECGTRLGGGALIWATILHHVNPNGRVITIDINDQVTDAKNHPLWKEKIDYLVGSSTDPVIVADVKQRVAGKKVLLILDSDHSKNHVLNEMKAYGDLVPVGGYMIVQDTNVNGHPVLPEFGPGPMEAVQEFLKTDSRFVSDSHRERLLFTMHPNGYLKRVK